MKRRVLAPLFALMLSCQAMAQGWQPFGVQQLGFIFDVPPDFVLVERSEAGDGASFNGPEGAFLAVWGMSLERSDFRKEIAARMSEDEVQGWRISYRRITSNWASYSGTRDGKIRYVRGIAICGDRAAMFLMDYEKTDKTAYDPIVTRMVRSLKPEGC